jgi:hypothetical protein
LQEEYKKQLPMYMASSICQKKASSPNPISIFIKFLPQVQKDMAGEDRV